MDFDATDESLLMPLSSIKTHKSDDEDETEATVSNTVLLLEENVKIEPNNELATEDPLNIVDNLHSISNSQKSRLEFQGEYNEMDFLNTMHVVDSNGNETNKRKRSCTGELKTSKVCAWSATPQTSTYLDNGMLHQPLQPKGKGPARLVANILEAWQLLFDEPILSTILKNTNEEIRRHKSSKQPRLSYQRCTDLTELRAWIGLNYLCGIFRVGGGPLEELWTPELGNAIFRASMSLKRFEFLRDCLQFTESKKKGAKVATDAELQEVSGLWEKFVINCRSYYAPSGNCALEEHIMDMAGTDCPNKITVSIPIDTTCTGIRMVSLHDAKTLYMCNAVVAPKAFAYKEEVLALVCDIKGTKRNVTLPPRYTTIELANILNQCQITLVGGMPAQAKDFPTEFATTKSRKNARKLYAGANTLIATDNNEQEVLLTSGISDRINAERLYAATVQSGKRFYQSTAKFSTFAGFSTNKGSQCRWTLRFFHNMLDFACHNAWLLYRLSEQGNAAIEQRDFQRQIGLFLTHQLLKRRLQKNSKIQLSLKLIISDILGVPHDALISEAVSEAAQASSAGHMPLDRAKVPDHVQLMAKTTVKRNRCRVCPSKNNIKTRWQCQQCVVAMCLTHLVMRCEKCMGIVTKPEQSDGQNANFC